MVVPEICGYCGEAMPPPRTVWCLKCEGEAIQRMILEGNRIVAEACQEDDGL